MARFVLNVPAQAQLTARLYINAAPGQLDAAAAGTLLQGFVFNFILLFFTFLQFPFT